MSFGDIVRQRRRELEIGLNDFASRPAASVSLQPIGRGLSAAERGPRATS
jgi:hypothetical protein